MDEFLNYATLYPGLPHEILLFFTKKHKINNKVVPKKVIEFCMHYQELYPNQDFPQPRIVAKMCDLFCEKQKLSVVNKGGFDGMDNSYYGLSANSDTINDPILAFYSTKMLDYLIYGFRYIYQDFKKYVLPIEHTNQIGDKSVGTCFLYSGGIVTAKHCIEGASQISIRGFSKEELISSSYEIHENKLMDLLYIRLKKPLTNTIMFGEKGEILDEVMTLGYPKIPGFHNFMTAENATISARYTTSVGQIVSNATDIWIKERLFLITAKIKGGNSGGPVITKNGSVIGVAVNLSIGDGVYDDLGYGTVIPVEFLDSVINADIKRYLEIKTIEFLDFV